MQVYFTVKDHWSPPHNNTKNSVHLEILRPRIFCYKKKTNIKHPNFPLLTFELESICKYIQIPLKSVERLRWLMPVFSGPCCWCLCLSLSPAQATALVPFVAGAASQGHSWHRYVLSFKLDTDFLNYSTAQLWHLLSYWFPGSEFHGFQL